MPYTFFSLFFPLRICALTGNGFAIHSRRASRGVNLSAHVCHGQQNAGRNEFPGGQLSTMLGVIIRQSPTSRLIALVACCGTIDDLDSKRLDGGVHLVWVIF